MNYLIDVLGSTIIAGVLMLMLFNLNVYQANTRISSDSELQLQQNAKTLAGILNHDLRKIGYEYSDVPFIQADSQNISFYSDINRDGTADVVSYFLGGADEMPGTSNPRDIILYRVVNNDTIAGPSLGLTEARFSYIDQNWNNTSVLSDIRYVKVELWIESIEKVGGYYIFTYWEMTINPRNL